MCLRKDIEYYRGAIFSSCIMVSCLALPACSLMLVLCWLVLMLMLTLALMLAETLMLTSNFARSQAKQAYSAVTRVRGPVLSRVAVLFRRLSTAALAGFRNQKGVGAPPHTPGAVSG